MFPQSTGFFLGGGGEGEGEVMENFPPPWCYSFKEGTVHTVKPRPEAHMDMILFEVFLKNIHLIPQDQIVLTMTLSII